jgi:hypothetical protein
MILSRRQFGVVSGAAAMMPSQLFAQAKPNSKIAGVQVGVMVPNSMRGVPNDLVAYRDALVKIGLSGCETHEGPFETFAGAPLSNPAALSKWREAAPMEKFAAGRKIWNDAGINIYAFKMPITLEMSEVEADYAFNAAKAVGASHFTMEMPDDLKLSARVGELGRKHNMKVGYHAHGQATPAYWDAAMAQSPFNCINLDIGHYVGAGNADAIAFVKKNHDRIVSMHLKDRKLGGPNMPWGQGDTPIIEVLHLVRDQRWGFPVTIELEYPIPPGSSMVAEVAKCYDYVKSALLS